MKRYAAALVALAALVGLGLGASPRAGARPPPAPFPGSAAPRGAAPSAVPEPAECPPGSFPDGDVCVHLPRVDDDEGDEAAVFPNAHRERSGRWASYDQIPRRPDRPADYDAYRYPVPSGLAGGGHSVVSGYDLDRPDPTQRRGRSLRAIGHGGVDLPGPRGTPVRIVALEHQDGDAVIVYAGHLFGTTVVTKQSVREGGRLRDYVVLFGHLDAIAPGVSAGQIAHDGDVIGLMGDTGSPELVHLHLEIRRVREGAQLTGGRAAEADMSIVCDPRNLLPLLTPPGTNAP